MGKPSESKKSMILGEKLLSFFLSDSKATQRHKLIKILIVIVIIISILCITVNVIEFLKTREQLRSLPSPSLEDITSLQNNGLANFIFFGGLISAIILIATIIHLIYRILNVIASLIQKSFQSIIIRPIMNANLRFGIWLRNNKLWTIVRQYISHNIERGRLFDSRYILYPMLKYLEPEIQQPEFEIFDPNTPPPVAFKDAKICQSTIERYSRSGQFIYSIYFIGYFAGLLLIGRLFTILGVEIRHLSSIVAEIFELITFVTVVIVSFPFLIGSILNFKHRQDAWSICLKNLQKKEELENAAKATGVSAQDMLQIGINRLRELYEQEISQTQTARAYRNEVMLHIESLDNLSLQEKTAIFWYFDQRRKDEEVEQKKRDRRIFLRERIMDFLIGLFFFLLGLSVDFILGRAAQS